MALINCFAECAAASTSAGYCGGYLRAYLEETVASRGYAKEKSVFDPSQRGLVPIRQPLRGGRPG